MTRLPQPPVDLTLDPWNEANDILYMHDLKGRFTAVNAMALQVYGYTEEELLAKSTADLVDSSFFPVAQENLSLKALAQVERTGPYELLTRSKQGEIIWVEVSTRLMRRDGKPYAVHGAARVITVRKQADAIADLIHETALSLGSAVSLDDGIGDAIQRIAKAAGWTYAEAWFPDGDDALRLGPQYVGAPGLEKFSRLAKQYNFTLGEGLPGRVWQTKETIWAPAIQANDDFPRRGAALAAGLQSYAAVPVLHDGNLAAVLIFLGPRAHEGQVRWVDAAKKIAGHLGASIGRSLDMERVRAAARMFAAQFESHDDALLLVDPEGRPRQANAAFLRLCGVTLRNGDAAVELTERLDDPQRFLSAVATLYEERSEGRASVRVGDVTLQRAVMPLRSRSGTNLGVMLRLRSAP